MQSVAVGWQIYEITKRPLDLGLVGLAQFLSGHTAVSWFPGTSSIASIAASCWCCATAGTFLVPLCCCWSPCAGQVPSDRSIASLFSSVSCVPSTDRLAAPSCPQLVPEDHFPSAVAWASSVFQAGTILGPAVGGVAYAAFHGPAFVYGRGRDLHHRRIGHPAAQIGSQSAPPRAHQPIHRSRRL